MRPLPLGSEQFSSCTSRKMEIQEQQTISLPRSLGRDVNCWRMAHVSPLPDYSSGEPVSEPTTGGLGSRRPVARSRDEWVSTSEGAHLRGRRTRNTKPEVELRRAVHRLGLRYRLHKRLAGNCTPDFVLPRWRLAIFVDGCFWHGCPKHSPERFRGPNAARWEAKLAANRARDDRNNALLLEAGWRVLRVWECEIKADVHDVAQRVAAEARIPEPPPSDRQ